MFFNRPQFFPKQLFFRFLIQQILGVVPALLLAALLAKVYLSQRLSNFSSIEEVVEAYDRAFLFLALVMSATVTGISLWTGYRLVLPLGRILVKARSILRRDYNLNARDEETGATLDEGGEWSDLESAIHRISRDMQSKERSLSREREEIEAILGAISEAVVAVDSSGNLLFFNSQFALLFGEIQKSDIRLSDLLRNGDILEAFRRSLSEAQPVSISTQLRILRENVPRHFSLSVAPLKLDDGQVYGVVGVFHDVTELKRMDQVRIDFVANVSHELRTPLTSIKGYAQTLKEDFKEYPSAIKFLDTIERNTDRLIDLVQDLLSISQLESGVELQREKVDLALLTERVCSQLDVQRAQKQHVIEKKVEIDFLWGDPKRLEQVLSNLVENAIKYVPPGGKLGISWEKSGQEVILKVSDNGPGISPEHQSRIFERFYRVDGARNREQGGTGLGLAIVKHIVHRHGGQARVAGGPGEGTVFICTFPSEKAH